MSERRCKEECWACYDGFCGCPCHEDEHWCVPCQGWIDGQPCDWDDLDV